MQFGFDASHPVPGEHRDAFQHKPGESQRERDPPVHDEPDSAASQGSAEPGGPDRSASKNGTAKASVTPWSAAATVSQATSRESSADSRAGSRRRSRRIMNGLLPGGSARSTGGRTGRRRRAVPDALLDETAAVHDEDLVGARDGVQPVGDDEHGPVADVDAIFGDAEGPELLGLDHDVLFAGRARA
ncbi:hypothetical protein [Nonomuraea aridisoli]|uniref:hypothetical protein n=1 Tax=Nonomuraea aridisoli TaxID=2070368 RepID=UPI001F1F9C23|nr:hypothetical protein [Nonomuraea aridisoli]